MLAQRHYFDGANNDNGDETDEKHQCANEPEYVHGLHAKSAEKP